MKKFLPILIALVVGIAVGALVFRGSSDGHDDPAESPGDSETAAAEAWTCSMHPQVQAPKPGLCPICAMDLIPLSELGSGGEGREFSMSESAVALAGIETTPVIRTYPEAKIRLYGSAVYDETRQKTIAARFPGRIDRLFIDYNGIRVRKGDHLAVIYSPDLLTAQTELLTAIRFDNTDSIRIARDKLRLWGFSDEKIRQIEESGKTSDQLQIDAPVSGIVTDKNVSEGDYVETGTSLFRINDLGELWIMFDAYESDKPWLRFGQSVEFTAEALPGQTFEGRISFISPELDPETRTFDVRVNFENEEELLKPGMFLRGVVTSKVAGSGRVIDESLAGKWISPMHPEIVKDEPGTCDVCGMDLLPAEDLGYVATRTDGKAPLVVPSSAVLHTGKRSVVYVKKPQAEEPTYEGREILLGPKAGEVYLVEAGLKEGEEVVTEGAFVIDSALQIQARPSMMLPSDEEAPLFRRLEVGDDFLTGFESMIEDYFAIQSALAGDDFDETGTAAQALLDTLEEIPVPQLDPDTADVWLALRERLEKAASKITVSADIDAARVAFEPLSIASEEAVRQFGTKDLAVFEAFCPMAFDDKGADWLQASDKLLNPYFGDAMLYCGEIKEQLAGPVEAATKPDEEAE